MPDLLVHHAVTLLLLIAWWILTAGVGRLCLRFMALPVFPREGLFLSTGLGLTLLAYLLFLLGSFQALDTLPLCLLTASLALMALGGWLSPLPQRPHPPVHRTTLDRWALGGIACLIVLILILVLTPEIGKDALIYHLAVPKYYLARQGFFHIPGNVFAGYPLLGEMHYLLALFYQGELLAKAMHWALLLFILGGIHLYCRAFLRDQCSSGPAMLVFISVPTVFDAAHMAYNDLFITFFTLGALYTFQRWTEEPLPIALGLCAFFAGSAAGCKYTALLLIPLGCLGILWQARRSGTPLFKAGHHLALFVFVALLVSCPFYLKNLITLGNPVYPFFYSWFGGMGWDAEQARLYDIFISHLGTGHSLVDYLLLPWRLSFLAQWDSPRFDGIVGPLFFFTLPFLLLIKGGTGPIRILMTYVFFAFLFWAFTAQQIRYLLPLLPPAAIAVGFLVQRLSSRRILFCLFCLFLGSSLIFNLVHIHRLIDKIQPWSALIGRESREAFLTRHIPVYPLYELVNHRLPPHSRVYLLYMRNFTYLCEQACYSDSLFEAHTLQKILRSHLPPEEIRDRMSQAGFTHLLYNEAFLLGEASPLSQEEIRRFSAFRERHLSLLTERGPYRLYRIDLLPAE